MYKFETKLNRMEESKNTAQTATDVYTMLAAGGFKVLIACEESQIVCKAFRALGIEAYSGKYDLMIAHPPCTYMSKAGARWMYPTAGNLDAERFQKAMEAKDMF